MKIASLDLGSNTFLLLIAEVVEKNGRKFLHKVIRDELTVVSLGQGVHASREFHVEALMRARECLQKYKKIIDEEKVDQILSVATSAARDVKNKEDFFNIAKELAIPISIIDGNMEAQLTYNGAIFNLENAERVSVIDVGGGSTEIIGKNALGHTVGKSLDIGALRLTEMFIKENPVSSSDMQLMKEYIQKELQENSSDLPRGNTDKVVAVSGTPTTIAALDQGIIFQADKINGYRLPVKKLKLWQKRLAAMSIKERQQLVGMDPKRADVIVAGVTILIESLIALGIDELSVSTGGVRYGLALNDELVL